MALLVPSLIAYTLSCLLPLVFAGKDFKAFRQTSYGLILVASALLTVLALQIFISNQPVNTVLLRITPGLAFSIFIDRLAALFIFIIAVVAASFAVYSFTYAEHAGSNRRKNILAAFSGLFIMSMVLFVASGNIFSQLLFWELMSLTSFFLVMFDYENVETQKSGLFYFVMTQMSTLFLLFAFIIIYNQTGSFALQPLSGASPAAQGVVFLALFIGFGFQ
jgi:formate hydrogenlyase subunit 3/multisubunit Na+/H+ antiporter MnhD subunit